MEGRRGPPLRELVDPRPRRRPDAGSSSPCLSDEEFSLAGCWRSRYPVNDPSTDGAAVEIYTARRRFETSRRWRQRFVASTRSRPDPYLMAAYPHAAGHGPAGRPQLQAAHVQDDLSPSSASQPTAST